MYVTLVSRVYRGVDRMSVMRSGLHSCWVVWLVNSLVRVTAYPDRREARAWAVHNISNSANLTIGAKHYPNGISIADEAEKAYGGGELGIGRLG